MSTIPGTHGGLEIPLYLVEGQYSKIQDNLF